MAKKITFKILRQANKTSGSYWESFTIDYRENLNVISALMELRKNPVTDEGKQVSAPTWDAACLEEVCGSCTMYINGKIRQACTALIEEVAEEDQGNYKIELKPMSKFPIIRDLQVDRSKMFDSLIRLKAWVPIDGSYDLGMAPPQDDQIRHLRYSLSRCMTCGCCMEACPQFGPKSDFVGPAPLAQALLFNLHPVGASKKDDRMDVLTSEEGITHCGNAQNCVKVCPKDVPLTQAIAQLNRDTTLHKIRKWIGMVS